MGEEWSLVLFTLLAQTSIGIVVTSQLVPIGDTKTAKTALLYAVGIMAASLVVSLTHLGDPLGAYRTLSNIGSSWLSREILFAGSYFGTAVLLYLTVAKGGSTRSLIGYIASLCGALTLISMSFIYTNTSYHAWSTVYTHLSFYGTAAVLGALTFSVIAATTKPDAGSMFYGKVLAIGATGAALQVFSLAPYLTSLAAGSAPMQATAKALYQSSPLLISGQILLAAGAFCFSFLAWKAYAKGGSKASQFIYIALLSVAAGELANRYLFYATGIHTMMGNF